MYTIIKTRVVREGKKPVAVIPDYNEYQKIRKLAQDREDYAEAVSVEASSKKFTPLKNVKKPSFFNGCKIFFNSAPRGGCFRKSKINIPKFNLVFLFICSSSRTSNPDP